MRLFKLKTNIKIYFMLLVLCIMFTSCFNKIKCSSADDKKLGVIDYTTEFKTYETESSKNSITFTGSDNKVYVFNKTSPSELTPRRLVEYEICRSIDVKPYTAYAYYEYENISNLFNTDSMVISIESEIANEQGVRTEVIFLNFAKNFSGLKGKIPISNIQAIQSEEPFGILFEFFSNYELDNQNYNDIWVLKKEGVGIYYSKTNGIVALEADNIIYKRN